MHVVVILDNISRHTVMSLEPHHTFLCSLFCTLVLSYKYDVIK